MSPASADGRGRCQRIQLPRSATLSEKPPRGLAGASDLTPSAPSDASRWPRRWFATQGSRPAHHCACADGLGRDMKIPYPSTGSATRPQRLVGPRGNEALIAQPVTGVRAWRPPPSRSCAVGPQSVTRAHKRRLASRLRAQRAAAAMRTATLFVSEIIGNAT